MWFSIPYDFRMVNCLLLSAARKYKIVRPVQPEVESVITGVTNTIRNTERKLVNNVNILLNTLNIWVSVFYLLYTIQLTRSTWLRFIYNITTPDVALFTCTSYRSTMFNRKVFGKVHYNALHNKVHLWYSHNRLATIDQDISDINDKEKTYNTNTHTCQ